MDAQGWSREGAGVFEGWLACIFWLGPDQNLHLKRRKHPSLGSRQTPTPALGFRAATWWNNGGSILEDLFVNALNGQPDQQDDDGQTDGRRHFR